MRVLLDGLAGDIDIGDTLLLGIAQGDLLLILEDIALFGHPSQLALQAFGLALPFLLRSGRAQRPRGPGRRALPLPLVEIEHTDPQFVRGLLRGLAAALPQAHGFRLERRFILPGHCPGFLLLGHIDDEIVAGQSKVERIVAIPARIAPVSARIAGCRIS